MSLQPRIDERSDEPGPHRALVIGGIARTKIAVILRFVVGMIWGERAQADRGRELPANDSEHRFPPVALQDRMLERDREYLVGPAGGIRSLFAVDDVVQ